MRGSLYSKLRKPFYILVLVIAFELAGFIGAFFTAPNINTWYANLAKPGFIPQPVVFGIVWTILYALMAISLFLIWDSKASSKAKRTAYLLFLLQFIANLLWSPIFFGLHSIVFGLIDIALLFVLLFLTIISFVNISKRAAYLLLPYFLWICFAMVFNYLIMLLN